MRGDRAIKAAVRIPDVRSTAAALKAALTRTVLEPFVKALAPDRDGPALEQPACSIGGDERAASVPLDFPGVPEVEDDPRYPDDSSYESLGELVDESGIGETDGLEELYALFSKGIRFYLCRQLGPQELDDKVHDTFVVVVQAIRKGELREPQRLMGFVRTIVRRQVAAHIDKVVHTRREQMDMESTIRIADPSENPEETAMFRQRNELIQHVLGELSGRDRDILTRFYLYEESQDQICSEMALTDTQFRLLKSRAKARFGELGKKKLAGRAFSAFFVRTSSSASH